MKTKQLKPIILIGCLIAVTCFAMASSKNFTQTIVQLPQTVSSRNGIVTLSGNLVQDKIVTDSDGIVSLALTMTAETILNENQSGNQGLMNNVDMVIVLDRSGSMSGQKINDATNAAIELVSRLTASDRFALVTYSNNANVVSELINVTPTAKNRLNQLINSNWIFRKFSDCKDWSH